MGKALDHDVDDLCFSVPSFFRCPISLDVMKSPVSLSTGVTYDRSSIQRWLDSGNNTCPATMQVLPSPDFVPNHTLHRLIQIWSSHPTPPPPPDFSLLLSSSPDTRFHSFLRILCFASHSPDNRNLLASNPHFVDHLLRIVVASQDPDLNPDLLEAVLKILHIVASSLDNTRKTLLINNPDILPSFTRILHTGRSESRVAVAGIIETVAHDPESKRSVYDNQELLSELLRVLKPSEAANEAEIQAVLTCLVSLSTPRRNKLRLIQAGGVKITGEMINKMTTTMTATTTELALTLLEMLAGFPEGRAAISEDPRCLPWVVHKLMKVSRSANEHGVALLWSVCYLFRDQKAREVVMRSNGGLTKILLLMQSDCSPAVKRMCSDLLRIFRVNSKSCLSSYDTKTTHIMPC